MLKQTLRHLLPTQAGNGYSRSLVHGSNPVPDPSRTDNQPTRPGPVLSYATSQIHPSLMSRRRGGARVILEPAA